VAGAGATATEVEFASQLGCLLAVGVVWAAEALFSPL
jgi:hypothetical protein